jgi:hypothetical protein
MRWEFKEEPGSSDRWRWHCSDPDIGSILKISAVSFKTLYDCVRDAAKHGYVAPPLATSTKP